MRLHRLAVTAFGPFPGRVEVDFDALTEAGLFLIHGATGAGKTSLLDAVCFALYADVPGARSKRGLRSDHATAEAVPSVELELTASGRRLRITRTPEYSRPKKRGEGLRSVHASVAIDERRGGSWTTLSTRPDEAAEIVRDALGMGLDQFAKVVMLPQGDFAAFLRASAEDRRELLERLFDITLFTDVEAWLADQRRLATAEVERIQRELHTDLSRLGDVLADQGPELDHGWSDAPLAAVPARLAEVEESLQVTVSSTMARLDEAATAERAAGTALTVATQRDRLRARGAELAARLRDLDAAADDHVTDVRRLEAARRAAALGGHLLAVQRAIDDERTASEAVAATLPGVAALAVEDRDLQGVVALLDQVRGMDRLVDDIARLSTNRDDVADRLTDTTMRRAALDEELQALSAAASTSETAWAGASAQVAELTTLAGELELRAERAARAQQRVDLAHEVGRIRTEIAELTEAVGAARGRALDARQLLLDLRQSRIDGMAAELAGSLADGHPCPVCGSPEHPAPARGTDLVTAEVMEMAEAEAARLDAVHHDLEVRLAARAATAEDLRTRLGGVTDLALLEGELGTVQAALDEAQAASDALSEAHNRLAQAQEARQTLAERSAALATEQARLEGIITELTLDVESLTTTLHQAIEDHTSRCLCRAGDALPRRVPTGVDEQALTHLTTTHAAVGAALTRHVTALEALADAQRQLARVTRDLDTALVDSGFAGIDAATAALLPAEAISELTRSTQQYSEYLAAVREGLADPGVADAVAAAPEDLTALGATEQAAKTALLAAQDAHTRATTCLRGLARLRPPIEDHCTALAPALERQARLKELADTVAGLGPDNTMRMRLTSFVLAARLEKVAELANERLAVMGAGRYRLEHSDDLAARGARSGLGLRVLDQWTGLARETATLSGGEAFMASLALALGLADAVREESGGLDLRTLFVDEGFGSLDDESLDQVLGVLDALREGGRAVGVVSHVAELRSRIPSQIAVSKGATGSTVSVLAGPEAPAA